LGGGHRFDSIISIFEEETYRPIYDVWRPLQSGRKTQ
jgi:hypothetical protein